MRAAFSKYLVEQAYIDEGLRLWGTLTETENRRTATSLMRLSAVWLARINTTRLWRFGRGRAQSALPGGFGRILDRDFEDNLAHGPGAVFGWQVESNSQVQIGIDVGQAHSGSRSLRLFFQVRSRIDTINVSQLVPVKPNTEYDFECYLKTDRLASAETPAVLIVNAADDVYLAGSTEAPTGNNDWQRVAFSFKTGPQAQAIKLRMIRNTCSDSTVCPIFGTVWYDDFDLKPHK